VAAKRVGRSHQHARRTDAALGGAVVDERLLKRRQLALSGRKRFHRFDGTPRTLRPRHQARADLLPVEQHGTRAAIACATAHFGAGQAEIVSQYVRESARRALRVD
jgi:hypothetical protein